MSARTQLNPAGMGPAAELPRRLLASVDVIMAGGGTGGHVVPLLAVAEELRSRGREVLFIGTRTGIEARLVPAKKFPIDYIEIGGLKGVGLKRKLRTMWSLPVSTLQVLRRM